MTSIVARDDIPATPNGSVPSGRCPRRRRLPAALLGACLAVPLAAPLGADDLDVYRARIDAQKRPNVLFVLDYSGSMSWDVAGRDAAKSGQPARVDILKKAVRAVIDDNLDAANFGIGSLYKNRASGVRWPTVPMRGAANALDPAIPAGTTNRDVIFAELDRLPARGGTATVNALAEAAAYFRGEPVGSALTGNADTWNRRAARYGGGNARSALPASYTVDGSARYATPVQDCRANAVILVSDGEPTVFNDNARIRDAVGASTRSCENLSGSIFEPGNRYAKKGNCGPEIARRLATPGNIPGHPDAVVNTYTIGFAINGAGSDYLEKVAQAGGGSAVQAGDLDTLTKALRSLLGQIGQSNQSFSAVSVDADRASFSHRDRAYFNLFEPSRSTAWRGNLKGYFLSPEGLRGLDGKPATATLDGRQVFSETAHSFWSPEPDGDSVLAGGASGRLGDARTLYTYLGPRASGTPIALAGSAAHALSISNPGLGATGLGLPRNASVRNGLIERLRAAPLGDPLHTRAVGLDYPGRKVVFTMTNQGFIHAFDTTRPKDGTATTGSTDTGGGEELWAFMPKRLLANVPALMSAAMGGDHVYGLDGGITRWHDDGNGDGVVDPGERMLLVFGMRRGGTSYYALDVSDPLSPKLVWEIDPTVPGFERLGESWSTPALVRAASSSGKNGQERFLVLGGGYDAAALDDRDAPTASRGNAVYVVDARGRAVWSIDGRDRASMRYAMPSDPTVIDSDADGLADRLYIGDLGGQVWRIDFDDMRNASGYRTTRLATLAGDSHQPFFYPPSVSYHQAGGSAFLAVSIGSGNRPDPMRRDSDNAFYMLRDVDVTRGPPAKDFGTVRADQLFDATDNALGSSDARTATRAGERLQAARGWRIDLRPGEKSLSAPVGFEGRLLATTFEPTDTIAPGACSPEPIERYYRMNIVTGQPLSGDGTPVSDPEARTTRLASTGGIPATPLVVFPKDSAQVSVLVGKQTVDTLDQVLSRVFWHAR